MHKKLKLMSWILNNLFDNVPPSLNNLLGVSEFVSEEALLCAFKLIAKAAVEISPELIPHVIDVEPKVILNIVKLGYAQLLQWLHTQGLSITPKVIKKAATWSKTKVLKMIYEIDPVLVCNVKVANMAARGWRIQKYNVLEWMWKTCGILPTHLGEDEYLGEWVAVRNQH